MKKLLAYITLVLALLSASAFAVDADTETSLWPAYDPITGLWGYIRADGTWGILPQYAWADNFNGDCAIVRVGDSWRQCGIIDRNAAFVLAPEYEVSTLAEDFQWKQENLFFVTGDEGMGWFDAENRYFSGLCWEYCEAWGDKRFIMVQDENWHSSLAVRATGELLLPLQDMDVVGFQEGVAVAMAGLDTLLIYADGSITHLSDGLAAADFAFENGLLMVENNEGLRGYVGLDGQIVIEPQFGEAESFRHGYAVVADGDGSWLIDHEGNRLAEDVFYVCGMWADGGIAVERTDCWAVLNPDGTERFRVGLDECERGALILVYEPSAESAPYWVLYAHGGVSTFYGLMTAEGTWVVKHGWTLFGDDFSGDPMGWQATGYDGGFIDAWGNELCLGDFLYTEHFRGALARVRLDASSEGYINRSGEVVYRWSSLAE